MSAGKEGEEEGREGKMCRRVSCSDSFEDSSGFGVEKWIIDDQSESREVSQETLAVVQIEGGWCLG